MSFPALPSDPVVTKSNQTCKKQDKQKRSASAQWYRAYYFDCPSTYICSIQANFVGDAVHW